MTSDAKICGATAKRTGEPCEQPAGWGTGHVGEGRCKLHGGASLAGPASGQYKTGKYSQYLPKRLKDRYEESLTDQRLMALREEIALTDARQAELVQKLDTGEGPSAWETAREAVQACREALEERDPTAMYDALETLADTVETGLNNEEVWEQIRTNADHRRKLVKTEQKRLESMGQMIQAERAYTLVDRIVALLEDATGFLDEEDQRRLVSDFVQGVESLVEGETQ